MSNAIFRYRSQFTYGWSAKPVVLRAAISFGAAGAPTIVSGSGMGISSVTRNSAGDYSIALNHAFASLMGVRTMFNAGASAPAAPIVSVRTDSVSSSAAPLVRISCRDIAAAAADPASGEIMYLEILLNDSSLGY